MAFDLITTLYRKRSRYVLKDSYTKWTSLRVPVVYLLCPYRGKETPFAETVHGKPRPVKVRVNRYECFTSHFPKTEGAPTLTTIKDRIDFDIGYGFHGLPLRSEILTHKVFNIRKGWNEDSIEVWVSDLLIQRKEERAELSAYYCRRCKRWHSIHDLDYFTFVSHEVFKPRLREPTTRTFFCTKHQKVHTIPKRTKNEPEIAYVNRLRKRWKYAKCLAYAYNKADLQPLLKKVIKSK